MSAKNLGRLSVMQPKLRMLPTAWSDTWRSCRRRFTPWDAGRANLVSAAQLADYNKERSQLLKNALADPSHVAWLTYGAEVETRIAELRSAFDMRGPEK